MSRFCTLMAAATLFHSTACQNPQATESGRNAASTTQPAAASRPDDRPGFPTREALVEACIAAVNAKDRTAYEAAIHPGSLAAINDANRSMFDKLYAKEFETRITERERTIDFKPYVESDPFIQRGDFSYTLPPTTEAAVRCETTYHVYERRLWALVEDDGRWFLQVPIPSAELVERVNAQQAEDEQFRMRARDIVAELQEPLRTELVELIRQGRSHTAARRYRQEYGVDMRDARMVIEVLADMVSEANNE